MKLFSESKKKTNTDTQNDGIQTINKIVEKARNETIFRIKEKNKHGYAKRRNTDYIQNCRKGQEWNYFQNQRKNKYGYAKRRNKGKHESNEDNGMIIEIEL